jgi:UDP-N-acetylmuramoylalanine--D-glutamate ligase
MMRLKDLDGRRVALWGLGREGRSTLRALSLSLPSLSVTIVDEASLSPETRAEIETAGVEIVTGDGATDVLSDFDVVVKSPGIRLYRPEVEALQRRGAVVTSATRLWFAETAPRTARTVCVTGTKGKSTTASLIAHLLDAAGEKVELRGNIGRPLLDPPEQEPTVWVIELSSYQTADLVVDPDVAVLLNLYPEHLDWHGDVETYYRDKVHLLAGLDRGQAVLNRVDVETKRLVSEVKDAVYFNDPEGFHVDGQELYRGPRKLADLAGLALVGRHNHENAAAALTAVEALGLDATALVPALASFRGLPHRLSPVGEIGGVLWVDDSISTTPQSAMAAIETYAGRRITIILGGFDRGIAYDELARFLVERRVEVVVTMPEAGRRIAAELRVTGGSLPELFEVADLEEAVVVARDATRPGGVVLLSPAAPSYGAFKNFEERGEAFVRAAGSHHFDATMTEPPGRT